MRVLTVVDAFRLGGAETLIAQLGRVAADADIDLQVLSILDRGPDRSALEPLLREVGLEPQYLGVRRTLDPTAVPRLVSFIRASGADVVHAHLEMAMTLALPAARWPDGPAWARSTTSTGPCPAAPPPGSGWRSRSPPGARRRSSSRRPP